MTRIPTSATIERSMDEVLADFPAVGKGPTPGPAW